MHYVYLIVNLDNGKVYVGQSVDPQRRWCYGHLSGAQKGSTHPFYRAIRKYGKDRFEVYILNQFKDVVDVNAAERFWIAGLNSRNRNHGYNLDEGGQGMSKEGRRKLSEALKGNKHCVGRKLSIKSVQKMSLTKLRRANKNLGEKIIEQESRTCVCGKTFLVEVIKNRCYGYEQVYCSSACSNRRQHSDETKRKISESLRHPQELELRERIKQGTRLVDLMNEFDVSYSKLKRLKRVICVV